MEKRLLSVGDIHGCFEQFRAMMEEKIRITKQDRIILIGDYIDRGPEILKTIDYIIKLKEKWYNLITLRGNHEVMLLNSFRTGDFSLWLYNGAESTLDSFGIEITDTPGEKYSRFFEDLLWYFEEEDYLFVHAGFSDTDPFNDRHAMVWTRNETYTNPYLSGKIIIHGHTPITVEQCIERVKNKSSVINIDTGCVYDDPGYGTLTAIELNSREMFFV